MGDINRAFDDGMDDAVFILQFNQKGPVEFVMHLKRLTDLADFGRRQ
jgi:hypothetical protein